MRNVDFSNRQRLQSASEIIYKVHILKLYGVKRTHNLSMITASLPNILLQRVNDKLMDYDYNYLQEYFKLYFNKNKTTY